MEDANLGDNIAEHSEVVDDSRGENRAADGGDSKDKDDVHLDPTRWWLASSAFPMIAGTLGPVASAFSICALVNNWRQYIPPGANVTTAVFVDDPYWLYVVNAIQLVIALVANVFLLLNMTKRVRFSIAQPITIAGWYISSILLIALLATCSGPLALKNDVDYVWAQAFYYGIFAAILYFVVASLMAITVYGANAGHNPKDFELTMSQRTLMLQTIAFLVYLLLGALVFSHVEGWLYLDALYWADVTLFTVGLGDLSPSTNVGRGLLIPYALIGILTLGLVIGSIRSLMLDEGKSKIDARMLEKKRRRYIRHLTKHGKGDDLEPITEKDADYYPQFKAQAGKTELERRHAEFQLMRKIQDRAATKRRWTALATSTSCWLVLWLVGAYIFQASEYPYQGWTYFDGVSFAFQAMTTIGYGDNTPVSNTAKAFFVFWSLLALPTLTVLISNAGDTIVKEIRDVTVLIGNVTILPGEEGFKKSVKQICSRLSAGKLFQEEYIHESPPGFLGAAQPRRDKEQDDDDFDDKYCDTELADNMKGSGNSSTQATRGLSSRNSGTNAQATSKTQNPKSQSSDPKGWKQSLFGDNISGELPKTRSEYHLVLVDEIRNVMQHLQESPPRRYTYQQWAWYLRLIGEDETDAATHRSPPNKPEREPAGAGPMAGTHSSEKADNTPVESEKDVKWSWVGHRSPLMDTRQEAQCILDKLSQRLREELQSVLEENEGAAGVRNAEKMETRYDAQSEERTGDQLV
ncbi:voltage-gated potassium channel [Xylariaceae sp. FL1019]|nr:voltage-gated potassium channel [Xylariaceae sp. FL1019]